MVVFSGAELGLDTDGRSLNFMEASSMSLGVPGRGMESSSISYSLTEDCLLLGEVECTSIPCLSPSSIGMTQNWVVVICGLKDEQSKVSTNQRATYSCWTAKVVLTGGLVPKTSPSPLPPPRPRLPEHRSAPKLHEQTTQQNNTEIWNSSSLVPTLISHEPGDEARSRSSLVPTLIGHEPGDEARSRSSLVPTLIGYKPGDEARSRSSLLGLTWARDWSNVTLQLVAVDSLE